MIEPFVTVLMPVYNAQQFLAEAIESILVQTYSNFEFIIINDGSTDGSEEIIKNYTDPRIKYYKNEQNLKLIATLNKGFDLATGKYIIRMDADDISLPKRIQLQVDLMEKDETIGLSGTWFDTFSEKGIMSSSRYAPDHETICFRHLYAIHLSHGTCIFRSSVLKSHGLYFDPEFSHAEDYELWSRISTLTKLANIQQVLYLVRQHEGEVSVKYANIQKANSYRVKTRLFKCMGIDVSTDELDLFQDIAYFKYAHDQHFLERTKLLLEKLMAGNNYEMFFSKAFFQNALADYWFNVHYNLTMYLGLSAYFHYTTGLISLIKPLTPLIRAKFILKGAFRK